MSPKTPLKQFLAFSACGIVFALSVAAPAAAQQCPDWRQNGVTVSADAETLWSPRSYPLTAGGGLDLSLCGEVPGFGQVITAPSFTITYDDRSAGHDLDFRVESQCDTVLLINDAGAVWHYNDDEDGTLNPRLRLGAAPSGVYDVWVGSYSQQACAATLVLETFPASVLSATCPDWSLGGAELRLAGGQAVERSVVAGGPVNLFLDDCGTSGHGHVAEAPDFSLYFDGQNSGAALTIGVQAQCDTVLLVNDPGTGWSFNDDHVSFDPQITFQAAREGRYDIWVGTYGDALCEAVMTVASGASSAVPRPRK
jgi:hypothetical protein